MKTDKSFTLDSILINTHDYKSPESTFDNRTSFGYGILLDAISVSISFSNENCYRNKPVGVHRKVSVALVDVTASSIISSEIRRVDMTGAERSTILRVDFPFAAAEVEEDHTYEIVVRNESTQGIIGRRNFQLYDEMRQKTPDLWFRPLRGFVKTESDEKEYMTIACDPDDFGIVNVHFIVEAVMHRQPLIMPEMEIRLHTPDNVIRTVFCRPEAIAGSWNNYEVRGQFFANSGAGCYAELLCLDYVTGGFVFSTDDEDRLGSWKEKDLKWMEEYSPEEASVRLQEALSSYAEERKSATDDDSEFDRLLDDFIRNELNNTTESDYNIREESSPLSPLENLVGLTEVKQRLESYEKLVLFNNMRKDAGLPVNSTPLHAVFLGSPGTGKTTVANAMGRMLAKAGILSRGHVVVKERSTLIGSVYGKEEENTLKAIEEAQGGILFIDEAYQLYQPNDSRDPARFVIETLLTALADESRRDWMLILAGYPDKMMNMFDINPGFRSRIPQSNIYTFHDFSENELMQIAENYFCKESFSLSQEARNALAVRLHADYLNRDRTFGNARHVINLIQTEIIPSMANRVMSSAVQTSLTEILVSDIPEPAHVPGSRFRIGYCA